MGWYYGKSAFSGSVQGFIWPTMGVFTSGYGWRNGKMHKGIDISNAIGTPIFASKDGIVSYSNWKRGEGKVIELTHRDGSKTRYLHCSRLLVKKGQSVTQGTRIGLMGNTGTNRQSHLGFEIRRPGGGALDPLRLLPSKQR